MSGGLNYNIYILYILYIEFVTEQISAFFPNFIFALAKKLLNTSILCKP